MTQFDKLNGNLIKAMYDMADYLIEEGFDDETLKLLEVHKTINSIMQDVAYNLHKECGKKRTLECTN
tara:strand:- start:291 stop:491 length:201 start_codon:yes stop_codon:yes gene_type:complete